MIAIVGGLGAALCWATATLCTSRSSRMIGAPAVLAWVMITGSVILGPAVAFTGIPHGVRENVGWLSLSGVVNVVGLLAVYEGLRHGKVGVVSAMASTEGAIAALIAAVAGETIGLPTATVLALIAGGVFLAALAPDADGPERAAFGAVLGLMAALCFGIGLYATGHVSNEVPLVWAAFPARLAGLLGVAFPLWLRGRLRLTRKAAPLVVTAGIGEVVGFLSYTFGARHGIAVTAVLASQFAAIAAIGAFVLFRERMGRAQVAGVATIVTGVAVLTALRA